MIIDFHMHERTFSIDARQNLIEMVVEAQKVGLDGICITDHDAIGLTKYAEKISKEMDFPIFVGVEYLALEGDIVAFGIDTMPEAHMAAQDFIDYMNEKGGVTIAAHPFRGNSRGLGYMLGEIRGLDGIEVLNGSTPDSVNKQAYEACMKLGLKPFGASDAHKLGAIGRYATRIEGNPRNVKELIKAIKTGKTEAVVLSGYKSYEF